MQERRTQNLRLSVLKRHKYTQQVQITILIIALTAFKWNNGKIDDKINVSTSKEIRNC